MFNRGGRKANLGEPKVMHLTSACGYVMEAQVAAATGGMLTISIAHHTSVEMGLTVAGTMPLEHRCTLPTSERSGSQPVATG